MKKFIIALLIVYLSIIPTEAKVLKGTVIGEISTYYPKEIVKIKVSKNVVLKNTELQRGYIVIGTMTDVKSAEKGDLESSFVFTIKNFQDLDGVYHDVKDTLSTTYKQKSPFDTKFFKETDVSFIPSMPIQTDTGIGGTSTSYKNIHLQPISIANSLLPEEYRNKESEEMNYRSAMPNDKDDILLLDGDKIKFNFSDM